VKSQGEEKKGLKRRQDRFTPSKKGVQERIESARGSHLVKTISQLGKLRGEEGQQPARRDHKEAKGSR